MRRIIEVGSALGATTIGLIGVVTETRAINYPYFNAQLATIPGGLGGNTWGVASGDVTHFVLLVALFLVGLSAGAYLHAVYDSGWGLAMLWVFALSLDAAVAFVELMPPSYGYTGGSVSAVALNVVPVAIPVVTVLLATVSALAAITPIRFAPAAELSGTLRGAHNANGTGPTR